MKKSLLILICLFAFAVNLINAQCIPDLTSLGHATGQVVPDSAVNLPHATVGVTYDTDIQLWVPQDTTAPLVGTITWINYTLNSVLGLPPGFSFTCNPTDSVFPANAASCMHLHGTAPINTMIGTWPLKVYITAHGTYSLGNLTVPDSITYYKIVIDSAASGIPSLNMNRFDVSQNIPNPLFSGNTEIDYSTPITGKMSFTVYNMLGQNIITRSLNAKQGMNQIYINSKELAPGIYMYSLNNGSQTITKRMVVGSR